MLVNYFDFRLGEHRFTVWIEICSKNISSLNKYINIFFFTCCFRPQPNNFQTNCLGLDSLDDSGPKTRVGTARVMMVASTFRIRGFFAAGLKQFRSLRKTLAANEQKTAFFLRACVLSACMRTQMHVYLLACTQHAKKITRHNSEFEMFEQERTTGGKAISHIIQMGYE